MQVKSAISIAVFALIAAWVPGVHAQSATPQQPVQQNAVNKSEARPSGHSGTAIHSKISSHHSQTRARRARRAAYRPEYAKNSVEVINGSTTQKVHFNNEEKPGDKAKRGPSQLKVEEVNGNATSTRYFYVDKNQPSQEQVAANYKKPVVVGVESSNTKHVGGNQHPVVTGITSAGSGDAASTSTGGEKLTTGVAGRPKRAPYQP